jgi:hypothetical protein
LAIVEEMSFLMMNCLILLPFYIVYDVNNMIYTSRKKLTIFTKDLFEIGRKGRKKRRTRRRKEKRKKEEKLTIFIKDWFEIGRKGRRRRRKKRRKGKKKLSSSFSFTTSLLYFNQLKYSLLFITFRTTFQI